MGEIRNHAGADDRRRYSPCFTLVLRHFPCSVSLKKRNSQNTHEVSTVLHSLTDVAAIWNANAFFAYVITVKMFKLPWERKMAVAVTLATGGVMAVIYGGASTIQKENNRQPEVSRAVPTAAAPLLGDLLTLVASVAYGLYQVLYKRFLALPSDPEREEPPQSSYTPIPTVSFEDVGDTDPLDGDLASGDSPSISDTTVYPPPFGLHPNLLTSLAGVLTLFILWIPLPILHYAGVEPFRWPSDWSAALVISGIALSGVIFNAGFMVIPWLSVRSAYCLRMFRLDSFRGVGPDHNFHRKPADHCTDLRVRCGIGRRNGGGDILEFHGIRRDRCGIWNFGSRPCRSSAVIQLPPIPLIETTSIS